MDRLSELPDSVIFHIFWLLPMSDVVRTTILSKRWKNLWTTTPFLNFDNYTVSFDDTDRLVNFVNQALLKWNGVRVLKLKLDSWDGLLEAAMFGEIDSCYGFNESRVSGYIHSWLRFAMLNKVEELYMHMELQIVSLTEYDFDYKLQTYWVPPYVYECSSLKVLSLRHCLLRFDGNVQWNQLKSLTIDNGCVDENVMNLILSGSPLLEVLILSLIEGCESLCIRSSSLKVLSINKYLSDGDSHDYLSLDSLASELRIWALNLERLEVKGIPYRKYWLMNVPCLSRATLGFYALHYFDDDDIASPGSETENEVLFTNNFLGDGFYQILTTIQHVENVTLSYCCIEVLESMRSRCLNSSFPNVKSVQLGYRFNDYEILVSLLEIFPQLKKLVLQPKQKDHYHDGRESLSFDDKSYLKFEAKLPKSFVLQLKTIEVTWVDGDNVFPFLEFLLKYASKLEKMVFRVRKIKSSRPSDFLFLVSKKLLGMPKSSPTAELIFYDSRDGFV
ncbi:putative F-box protein At1g49610 [Salvia miltiorrhiza]|uniref:putative F-box protein At1g49610 n=1 Tax=Salvia miltiorrhiza TaxID=226208 RepID=UPI0025AB72D4|nr:putative F-box protein At1g49610 [Salvia miltiorrhiza]